MTDRMSCRAKVGDTCVTTRGMLSSVRYRLRIVSIVSDEGLVEATRNVRGKDERRRMSDETIYLVALRPTCITGAAELVRECADRGELELNLRALRDETAYDGDRRIDGRMVEINT